MKVVVGASTFAEAGEDALNLLVSKGIEVVKNPFRRRMTEEEIIEHLKGAEGLLAGLEPLNENVLSHAPTLKAIARIGIGTDNVDFDACKRHGVKVSNTPDAPTLAVAEMTIAALFSILRMIVPANEDMHKGIWKKQLGESFSGQKVLIVGYGRIGKKVAEYMRFFGAQITVYDPFCPEESVSDLREAVKEADIISIHASGKETIFDDELFSNMKQGVILLNSSRGTLLDEKALENALQSGTIRYFWGDVFAEEPYSGNLIKYENAILTPHISSNTKQCRLAMEMEAAQNIIKDLGL